MTIHTVQNGDTPYSIADQYNIPYARLIRDNDLNPNIPLNIGQNLMIIYPEKTYIVQDGDTLESISAAFNVTLKQLLRNNPQLSDMSTLVPEEELVISYANTGKKKVKVNGFVNAFINLSVLKKTLPYLTYLTILNFKVADDGNIIEINDADIVKTAYEFGVAPLMFLSTFNEYGTGSYGIIHSILYNNELQDALIHNTLNLLKAKGYYGLYIGFEQILHQDLQQYSDFINNITNHLNQEGYEVFVSLIPSTFGFKPDADNTEPFYNLIGQHTNYVTLITFLWTSAFISQYNESTPAYLKKYLDYAVTQIPPEKIFIGYTRIAYDWELPYVEGVTQGKLLSNYAAVNLASQLNATIQYDPDSQSPYYYYYSLAGVEHFVWFKDAKTIDTFMNMVTDYGIAGVALWNIMYYYPPTFLVINTQYEIESVLDQ